MELTINRKAIKEYADKKGITIFSTRIEKRDLWGSANDGVYQCEQCGKERQIGEPFSEHFTCWECFNESYKLPFYSYDTETYYIEANTDELPDKVLEMFKNNTDVIEVIKLLKNIKDVR